MAECRSAPDAPRSCGRLASLTEHDLIRKNSTMSTRRLDEVNWNQDCSAPILRHSYCFNKRRATASQQLPKPKIRNYPATLALIILLVGCSSKDQVGAPGIAGPGGAATTDVAGLKIEVEPIGSDGGAGATINSEEEGTHDIAIGGVSIELIEQRDSELLRLTVEGKEYGLATKGDHLRINRSREVFLNNQLIKPESAEVENAIQIQPNGAQ